MHDRVASLCAREGLPKPAPERADSPVHILAEAARLWRDRRAVAWLERFLRDHEAQAARLAPLTRGARGLVRELAGRGKGMAVATNNSQEVVAAFLRTRLPAEPLSGRVYGRQDLGRDHPLALKPDPDCINRAMKGFPGLAPENFLMIGDSADDLHAAKAAGVNFLGIRHPDGSAPPEGCPPWAVVESMEEAARLLALVTPPLAPPSPAPQPPPAAPCG